MTSKASRRPPYLDCYQAGGHSAVWRELIEPGEQVHVEPLRAEALRVWGGFPFWQWSFKRRDFYAPGHYRPNFAKLVPVMKEGLVEL